MEGSTVIESLESRRMLAANTSISVTQSGTELKVIGSGIADRISVSENAGAVVVQTSHPGGPITTQTFGGITAIKISGNGGGDEIFYDGNSVGADIHGDASGINSGGSKGGSGGTGGGSDGGHGGNSKGGDQITVTDSGTGRSTVDGDGGQDVISLINGNKTVIYGGEGDDQVFVNTAGNVAAEALVYTEQGKDTVTVYAGTNTLDGGQGKDLLIELGGNNTYTNFEKVV
jgi:Ca2+-binding RTX toxin-like protein